MDKKTTSMSDFEILGKLGQGAFGQVFKVKRKADDNIYALKKVKIASMKQKDRQNALNQIRILASYQGQYIIGYKDSFFDQITNTLCVVMQFAGGGDVLRSNQTHSRKNTHYPQSQIWKALVDITKGVKSLHDRKILHRDLKAANIFKTADGTYKLGDLNVSKVLKKDLARTQTGTPYYVSPQIWKDKPYGVKSDMWSLGCVIYQMAALRPPFLGNDLQSLYRNVCKAVYPRIPNQYSQDLAMIINSMLKQDPSQRSTTQDILSNPIVHKNYSGQIEIKPKQNQHNSLLKTLKLNHRNLRALKNILPRSKYQDDKSVDEKQRQTSRQRQKSKDSNDGDGSNTNRSQRKSIKQIMNDKKINNFIQAQQKKVQQNRKKLLEAAQKNNQNQSDKSPSASKKRQRVLSACGLRRAECMTPQPKRKQNNVKLPPSVKNPRKQSQNYPPIKLPPKPQVQNQNVQQPGIIPRPPKILISESNQKENRSYQNSREKSKQNFRNIGQNILKGQNSNPSTNESYQKQRVRCSSAKKIVYPSWWMD